MSKENRIVVSDSKCQELLDILYEYRDKAENIQLLLTVAHPGVDLFEGGDPTTYIDVSSDIGTCIRMASRIEESFRDIDFGAIDNPYIPIIVNGMYVQCYEASVTVDSLIEYYNDTHSKDPQLPRLRKLKELSVLQSHG
jgi:hypothetical protein